jgi:hypothetical protein
MFWVVLSQPECGHEIAITSMIEMEQPEVYRPGNSLLKRQAHVLAAYNAEVSWTSCGGF